MIVVGFFLACGVGGASMMAEGPHGPNGEIASDPKNLPVTAGAVIIGLIFVAVGLAATRKRKDDDRWRKRD